MPEVVWELPISTGRFVKEPHFESIQGRVAVVGWTYVASKSDLMHQALRFSGVRAGKWTIESACTAEMVSGGSRLVDMGATSWLTEVNGRVREYGGNSPPMLRHLRIFVDGPGCFEIICEAFEVTGESVSPSTT